MKTQLQVLQETRDIISDGWTQGTFTDRNRYCLFGALAKAEGGPSYRIISPGGVGAYATIKSLVPGSLICWNDNPRTTKLQVLTVLDSAIRITNGS